jgi:LuxR family transcriptional regulator, maltose regulon positive regulatory protein
VLLVAPAGYGKTTVLSEWAGQDPRPFRWLQAGDPRATLAVLAEEAAVARHPFVLVLDDAHRLRDADAGEVLQAIVDGMPPGSQLALAARCEPALAVGRLRAHRGVVELRAADLAMDRSEAAVLLAGTGLRLDADDLDTLVRRTEGWPAGLYLAALSLLDQPDVRAAVKRFAGDDHLVADYLRDELLSPLSTDRISFLVRTSVLDTLSASACDALLEDTGSGRTLADLARSNSMLLSVDRSGDAYRHHGLFAEMLRAELRRAEPELERRLHRRASAWYSACGETGTAIRHLIGAGDIHEAAELVWAHAAACIAGGGKDTVRRWLDEFTTEQIAASAPLAIVAAAYWLAAGDRGQVERWTMEAERTLDPVAGETNRPLRVALAVLQASAAPDDIVRMGSDGARAADLEPDDSLWRRAARLLEGVAQHLTGRPGNAWAPLEEGARGGASAAPNIRALCLAQLALLALDGGDWNEAAIVTARARSQVKASGLEDYPTMSLVFAVSGLVRAQRGMVDEAREDVRRSTRLLGRLVDFAPWYEAEARIVLARTVQRLGDVGSARGLVAEAAHALRDSPESTTLRTWLEETSAHLDAASSASEAWALTPAELRVLQLLPTHLSLAAIASRLYVSPNTVKTHAQAVYRKLDASSRGEAVAHAYAAGLLDDVQAA